jgi:hypothetical protein
VSVSHCRALTLLLPLIGSGCSSRGTSTAAPLLLADTAQYTEVSRVGTFPTTKQVIDGWIATNDSVSIRHHAWSIWGALTAPSGRGDLPVWQTFHSGHELFEMARPRQPIPVNPTERRTAFNRFSLSTANYIATHQLNFAATLDSINRSFNAQKTPIAERQVFVSPPDSVDPLSLVLKPVFQFIAGDRVTAVPYWAGSDPAHSVNDTLPTPETWRQGVAVDPTGKLPVGSSIVMRVNGGPPRALKVVHLSSFYWIRLTQADVDSFSTFVRPQGDYVGKDNKRDSLDLMAMIKPGNVALLMALHVTGKEIPNWTWQTFWWSPFPANLQYGADRPTFIAAPWNNYLMNVAYSMTQSPTDTTPRITFNPYLETNLNGRFPDTLTSPRWFGIHTNCMTCHRLAARGTTQPGGGFDTPPYGPAMFVSPGDSALFAGLVKTDFLWSVAFRAQPTGPVVRPRVRGRR